MVRSSARRRWQKATHGSDFPFPVICDGPGVLYGYLGVEQARGILSWSFAAQRIYKTAREQGYRYDTSAPQLLPLTLVVGHQGRILFTHSGRSQTDLPRTAPPSARSCGLWKRPTPTDGPAETPTARTRPLPCPIWWGVG